MQVHHFNFYFIGKAIALGLLLIGLGQASIVSTPTVQANVPRATGQILPIVSAGNYFNCALVADNTLRCWGENIHGESDAPNGTFMEVSAGQGYACALKPDGSLQCWGVLPISMLPSPAGVFKHVSSGIESACAIKSDDTVQCWGGIASGGPDLFQQIDTGRYHVCGVLEDGAVQCWGGNKYGQATAPDGTYKQVSSSTYHSCGVRTDDTVHCWGAGKTNTGVFPDYGEAIDPEGTFTQVDVGTLHTCGIKKSDGTIHCWGANSYGQSVDPNGTFVQVSTGNWHTCAVRTDKTIHCWGMSDNGELSALGMGPSALPDAFVGIPFSQTLTASNGTAPYLYGLLGGTLPKGIHLAGDGVLSGTPKHDGIYPFTAEANDSNGLPGQGTYTLQVCGKPPKPILYTPERDMTIHKKSVPLDWSDTTCTGKYKVVIKDAATGAVVYRKTLNVSKIRTTPLDTKTYKWSVRACNPLGCTKSAQWRFTIQQSNH